MASRLIGITLLFFVSASKTASSQVNCSRHCDRLECWKEESCTDCSKLQFWNKDERIRNKSCTESSPVYHCAWDLFAIGYRDICRPKPILIRTGKRPTIQGGLHFGICREDRYQPTPVLSTEVFDCWFLKSNCTEEGQVSYNGSRPDRDRNCTCDYRRGYAFVNKPRNKCYCVPSEEDCSCYKSTCLNETHCLDAEYQCVEKYDDSLSLSNGSCLTLGIDMSTERSSTDMVNGRKADLVTYIESISSGNKCCAFIVTLFILYVIIIVSLLNAVPLNIEGGNNTSTQNSATALTFNIYGPSNIKRLRLVYVSNEDIKECVIYDDVDNINTSEMAVEDTGYCLRTISFTIDEISKTDAGIYRFSVWNNIGIKRSLDFRPTAKPSYEAESELQQHTSDKSYYRTSQVEEAIEIFDSENAVFVLGHEGTGKSKLCLEVALEFSKKGFSTFKFSSDDIKSPTDLMSSGKAQLYIYDINMDVLRLRQLEKDLIQKCKLYSSNENLKFIFTVMTKYQDKYLDEDICPRRGQLLLNHLCNKDKHEILLKHMKENKITTCDKAHQSNYEDVSVVSDPTKVVKIYIKMVGSIVDTNSFLGFPKACHKFCSDRSLLHLEHRYFNTPPHSVVTDINSLRTGQDKSCKVEYVVLVYILMKGQMKLSEVKQDRTEISSICKKLQLSSDIEFYEIKDAADRLGNTFLTFSTGIFTFYHPALAKAVWMSYIDIDSEYCLLNCEWSYIEDLVRPNSWIFRENDVCIGVEKTDIMKRLLSEIEGGHGKAWSIGQYLCKFSKCGTEIIEEFCAKMGEKMWDIDISLNLFNGLSDLGTSFSRFAECQALRKMLFSFNIDKFGNCLLHYCVLQQYDEFVCQIPENFINEYMSSVNDKNYSACHLEFYFGRRKMIEKHLHKIPREYEYYSKLNKLVRIGDRSFGKVIESKHLSVLGQMNMQSDVLRRSEFGSKPDFKVVRDHLQTIKKETMLMVRIKNLPRTTEDDEIQQALALLNCTVLKQYREKYLQKGRITNIETGDRIVICKPLDKPLPKKISICNNIAETEHDGQNSNDTDT